MPFTAFYLYRALSGNAPLTWPRRVITAVVAGYVSVNLATFLTAVELGLQPILFRDAQGRALYFPYDLSITIPAMMLPHLTFAGLAEALVTGLVVVWLQRTNLELLEAFSGKPLSLTARGLPRWAWGVLIVLVILTPISLLAPGTAWGEWGREELEQLGLGYIPAGFDEWSNLWSAPIPDYDIPALDNPTLAYLLRPRSASASSSRQCTR